MSAPSTAQGTPGATATKGAAGGRASLTAGPTDGVPFTRVLLVELRKQVDTRAGRWLLIAIGIVTALVMAATLAFNDPEYLTFENLVLSAAMPQMFLLPVVGIMAATSEWTQRTGMVTFALEPRRGRVIAAKLLSAVGLALLAVVTAVVLGAVANVLGTVLRDGSGSWDLDLNLLGGFVLIEVLVVAQGVAFGLILLNTPAAIVVYYLLPTAWSLITSLVSWLREPSEWLDMNRTTGPLLEGTATGDDWAKIAVSVAVWVLLPVVLGTWRVLRREVK